MYLCAYYSCATMSLDFCPIPEVFRSTVAPGVTTQCPVYKRHILLSDGASVQPFLRFLFQILYTRQKSVMSDCDSSCQSHENNSKNDHLCEGFRVSEDEGRRLKRREKNRVAAQKSRKRQTQRADLLHQACELLEQRNRKLRREVDCLSEEQRLLTEALRAHEPMCSIMHCSLTSSTSCSLQPENMAARSV
ncbi:Basic leucine zipper transcriptional factor ATF-like 3 [Channa argus]|uniref:Basic leucine zipper transcriptional factor ATF-like 3 n=1 Tax=Channa argus TaxID=215402 RepID=A0A6G1QKH5_CHAAH|nr:Basic leucine zipper transcriptional factor ATF-like 3 [Channa argus]